MSDEDQGNTYDKKEQLNSYNDEDQNNLHEGESQNSSEDGGKDNTEGLGNTSGDQGNEYNEMEKRRMSRRKFIRNSSYTAGGLIGGGIIGGLIGNQNGNGGNNSAPATSQPKEQNKAVDYSETRMFFKRKEDFDVLSKATERILPEDDNGPGAIELGVPYFIDKQLAGQWGENAKMYMKRPFQKGETPLTHGEMFLQGVRKINDVSQKQNDSDFADLDDEQQDKILESFEKDKIKMEKVSSAVFFSTLIQSTLEGAYSDPMYSGNKDMKGWAMKEYPGPRMSHRDRVEEGFEVFEKMERKSLKTHM